MLGKLVNKFKRQTLQDGAVSPPGQLSPPPSGANSRDGPTRRSARLNGRAEQRTMPTVEKGVAFGQQSPSPPNTRARRAQQQQMEEIIGSRKPPSVQPKSSSQGPPGCDSGTESDDDELEMLDSLSNASRAALEDGIIGRSPPTLTSSPPLISEFETSSWDSCGCESGIVLRDSAERDDASRNVDLLEAAFGGGHQLVMEIGNRSRKVGGGGGDMDTAGTTPVQSKDAFPAHFRSGTARPLPIDFSALRHSELLFSAASSPPTAEDAPTPIGSHKGPGQGAILMEMAQLENIREASAAEQQQQQQPQQQQQHQGAFRRVLRRTRRNSNSQPVPAAAAAHTVSPTGVGLGEKRRWDAPAIAEPVAMAEETPIAARTRGSLSLMGGLLGGGGQQPSAVDGGGDRPVLTAARRTRVRVLYSAQEHPKGAGGFPVPLMAQGGRRGQVAPMLGQSPPNMLANKRGRHCSKGGGGSPPRPSLNFDKMRKRMLNGAGGGDNGPVASGGGVGSGGTAGVESGEGAAE